MRKLSYALLLVATLFSMTPLQAADILAGFVSARQVSGLEYEFTATIWTNDYHQSFKRCAIDLVVFHNGTPTSINNVPRVNGPAPTWSNPNCNIATSLYKAGEVVKGPIRKNVYQTRYTFPGTGTGKVVFQSFAREINLINLTLPELTNFNAETEFDIIDGSNNSSPQLDLDLLRSATSGQVFNFVDYVSDPDGDDLTYAIRVPGNVNMNNYNYPSAALYGGGAYGVDANTGEVTWNTPTAPVGLFLVSIEITSSRNGSAIGFSHLDFVIEMDIGASLPTDLASGLQVSPNPAQDQLALNLDVHQAATVSADLMDLSGRKVQQLLNTAVGTGSFQEVMDLDAALSNGLYLLKLTVNDAIVTRKVMIQR